MSARSSPAASTRTGCMAPLMLIFREPPKSLPASVTNTPSSRMWTRICATSKVVPVAKSPNPPLVVYPNDSGPHASTLRSLVRPDGVFSPRRSWTILSSWQYPFREALPQCLREHAGMFQEGVDWRVARKSLDERQASLRVLLASLEEGLEQHQVRHQVDQRVSREMLPGPPVPQLAFVAGQDRGGELLPYVGLVGPRGGQPARLQGVTDALPAYGVDHATGVSDHHQPLTVALRAPHPHLERPARWRTFRRSVLQPGCHLRNFEKAVEEVFEVPARAGKRCCRDACPDVRLSVSEVEDPAVARAVRVHVLRDKDVQVLLVRAVDVSEVLPAGDGVLVGLHPFAREASDAVGHDYQRCFE